MEHDIIYKPPRLEAFGGEAMKAIDNRMRAIMRDHLIPAGHEFAKVDYDFQRLSKGLELFDRAPLEELVAAGDNNARHDVLERFITYVLPNYDDLPGVYPEIRQALRNAVVAARETPDQPIQTAFGAIPGHSQTQLETLAARVFERLRYLDIEATFDAVSELYAGAGNDETRKIWIVVAEKHQAIVSMCSDHCEGVANAGLEPVRCLSTL